MDRVIVEFGQLPLDTDILSAEQFAMVGLCKLAEAVLGTGVVAAGFATTPATPASLSVVLGPGQLYQQAALEATPFGSLPADGHVVLKQGVLLDPTVITLVPPTTPGFAQNFLVEVAYSEVNSGPVVRPYYNAAQPSVPFDGPAGAGAADNTIRRAGVAYQVKAGVAATAGTQTTPAPDAGYVGLYVVTLAQGQTTITANSISPYPLAPFLPATLSQIPQFIENGTWTFARDVGGAAGSVVASLVPAAAALVPGMSVRVLMANPAAAGATFNYCGLGAQAITHRDASALSGNEWTAGSIVGLDYDGARWQIGSGSVVSGEGVVVASGKASLAYASLAQPGVVNDADLFCFFASEAEGGQPAAHHYAGTLALLKSYVLGAGGNTGINAPSRTAYFTPAVNAGNATSGTWTVPAGVYLLKKVKTWGPGGGGGATANNGAGSGGGAGGYVEGPMAVTPGQVIAWSTPLGALGGTTGSGTGANGATASWGSAFSATGGMGGANSAGGLVNGGGAGGAGTGPADTLGNPAFTVKGRGGVGGTAFGSTSNGYGAGFGSAAFQGSAAPGVNYGTVGSAGAFPGGGAAGSASNGTGAVNGPNGADSLIVVEY